MNSLTSIHLVQIYLAHSLAFSICLLVFIRTELARNITFWIISNLLGAAGFVILQARGDEINFYTFIVPNALIVIGGIFRALAIMPPITKRTIFKPASLLLFASAVTLLLILVPTLSDFRLLLVLSSSVLLSISCAISVRKNRLWAGTVAQKWLSIFLAVSILGFAWRISQAYPFGPYKMFIGQTGPQYVALVMLLGVSFFLQIAFMLLVSERLRRNAQLAERRASRAQERASQMVQRRIVAEKLAKDRLNMLNILTHEVRQPLNNAQAALQSVLTEIEPTNIQRDKLRTAATRAQSVLDDITLAISNSIVGTMVVQRKQEANLHECEVLTIAELARTDCPLDQSSRIRISADDHSIFLAVDPILLRLALRNLLHNAVKFSPSDSCVELTITLDADRLGASFQVTNTLTHPGRVSGGSVENGHLGLFVVTEIARVHNGSLSVIQPDDAAVTFELFIPK